MIGGFAVGGAILFLVLVRVLIILLIGVPLLVICGVARFERWRTEKLTQEGKLRPPLPHWSTEPPPEQPGTWRLRWPGRKTVQ